MEGIPVGPRLSTHMLRHVWAADRLWEGLFAADPRHWSRGAQVLMEDPLPFFARLRETPEVGRHAERVHELGAEALATDDRVERARIYGELIATCADCHRAMGVPREGR